MHDDKSLEHFLAQNKPQTPAAPENELRLLQARLAAAQTPPKALWRRRRTGLLAACVSAALALMLLITRQPHPASHGAATEVEAVLQDSYSTLDDLGEDEGSEVPWLSPAAAVD